MSITPHPHVAPSADTPFTRLVGCELPIQQAPIGFAAAEIELPLAVARAGGHGMLAAVRMPAAHLATRLDRLNAHTRAYGVNFIQALLDLEALDVAAQRAPLIELYLGPADPGLVQRACAGGALVSRQIVSVDEARSAEQEGCHLVVARGVEAGGRTTGDMGLLALLEGVLDAVTVPVIAAGGIATARGVAACLAVGAAGVRVGTRFLVAHEAAAHPVHAEAVLAARPGDTVLTDAFSVGAPISGHRVLRTALEAAQSLENEWAGEMTVAGRRVRVPRFGPDNPSADATGAVHAMALYAGEGVGAVRTRQSAAAIVCELATPFGTSARWHRGPHSRTNGLPDDAATVSHEETRSQS